MKMTHKVWMKETAAMTRPRSSALKQVDNALAAYEKALEVSTGSVLNERKALQKSLQLWKDTQKAKGQQWQSSVRNKKKTVEKLDAELGHVIVGAGGMNSRGVVMDTEEMRASKELSRAIKQNTKQMFTGQKLTVKNSKALADIKTVGSAMLSFKKKAKAVKQASSGAVPPAAKQQIHKLIADLFGGVPEQVVKQALGPDIFADFITNVTPFLGVVKSGGKAALKWGQAAKGLHNKHKMASASSAFAPGDPAAAFAAIVQIQQREINANVATASVHTVSAGAKAAFTAADLGTLSGALLGAAETLALLVQKIYLFARDWNEMNDVNKLLASGTLDLTLFKTCPLLGCYLIANSDTSSVINMAVGDYGKTGWKFEVEAMLITAKPVFEKAKSVINNSRFEFVGMRGMKGATANRNASTLGVPTGKIAGMLQDAGKKVDQIGA